MWGAVAQARDPPGCSGSATWSRAHANPALHQAVSAAAVHTKVHVRRRAPGVGGGTGRRSVRPPCGGTSSRPRSPPATARPSSSHVHRIPYFASDVKYARFVTVKTPCAGSEATTATGVRPPLPARLGNLFDREERYERLPGDYDAVKAFVLAEAARG